MPEDCISNVDGPSFRLRELAEVSSTNDVVKRALEAGEPEGLAVRACRQTGGYGRQGRTWTSPEGGLYLSLLLRPRVPSAQLPTLSLVAGLAVREAVASFLDTKDAGSILVKWPNDVVVRQSCREGLCGHKTADSCISRTHARKASSTQQEDLSRERAFWRRPPSPPDGWMPARGLWMQESTEMWRANAAPPSLPTPNRHRHARRMCQDSLRAKRPPPKRGPAGCRAPRGAHAVNLSVRPSWG